MLLWTQQPEFVEMNLKAGNCRRGYARYAPGLAEAARTYPIEFFHHLMG